MLDFATLRTKEFGQEAVSADDVRGNARAKAVRASYEFWSTGNEAPLEEALAEVFAEASVRPLRETTGLESNRPLGAPEKALEMSGSGLGVPDFAMAGEGRSIPVSRPRANKGNREIFQT